jgi:hypothetical protein
VHRRVHVRAVVRGDMDILDGPTFALRQVFNAQAGKDFAQQRRGLGMIVILDLRSHKRWIEHRIVIKRCRNIHDACGQLHGCLPSSLTFGV